nr:hypothetical protein [Salmonid herpesvirus 1]
MSSSDYYRVSDDATGPSVITVSSARSGESFKIDGAGNLDLSFDYSGSMTIGGVSMPSTGGICDVKITGNYQPPPRTHVQMFPQNDTLGASIRESVFANVRSALSDTISPTDKLRMDLPSGDESAPTQRLLKRHSRMRRRATRGADSLNFTTAATEAPAVDPPRSVPKPRNHQYPGKNPTTDAQLDDLCNGGSGRLVFNGTTFEVHPL